MMWIRGEAMMSRNLLNLKPGESGKVKHIDAGKNATRRLYEIGLCTGAPVKVVKNDIGPVIVSLVGNKIALGRGLAMKVRVETDT
jgi:ferrous iron transport protein A